MTLFEGPTCKVFGQGSPVDSSPLTQETKRPGAFQHTSPPGKNALLITFMMILILVVGGATGFFFGVSTDQLSHIEMPFSLHWRTPAYTQIEPDSEPSVPIRALPVPSPTVMRLDIPVVPIAKTTAASIAVSPKKIPDLRSRSQVVETRNRNVSTIVGSTLGAALAPMMISTLNILAAGVTIPTVVTAALFTAGLVSITAHAAHGLFSLIQSLLRRNTDANGTT